MLATLDRGDTVLVPGRAIRSTSTAPSSPADIRSVRMTPDVDFFEELQRAIKRMHAEAEDDDPGFLSNPDGALRRTEFFEKRRGPAR